MSITNADISEQACELAEGSEGLLRMAALCVCAAAFSAGRFSAGTFSAGTFCSARKALEVIPHAGLRDDALLVPTELAAEGAAEVTGSGPQPR